LSPYSTACARRVADFLKDRPVSYVLGGHIEKSRAGKLFPWQSTFHPDERALPLRKVDVLTLPAALREFNGFYSESGDFVIENPIRNLIAAACGALVMIVALGILLYRVISRRRRRQRHTASALGQPMPIVESGVCASPLQVDIGMNGDRNYPRGRLALFGNLTPLSPRQVFERCSLPDRSFGEMH
jgi:hypothetical protein